MEGFLGESGFIPEVLGRPWDNALPPAGFDTTANAFLARGGTAHPATSMSLPDYISPRAYVRDATYTITWHPQLLAWFGYVCDYILFLARLAWDLARDYGSRLRPMERDALRDKARLLGRYALRIIADRGRVQIHELDHVWQGRGGHCSAGSCCFELSAQRWLCSVSAWLGLPLQTGTANAADTWADAVRRYEDDYCATITNSVLWHSPDVYCWLADLGETGGRWAFACSDCYGGDLVGEVSG